MAVVIISRQFGAGGRTIGEAVAKRLGYQFVSATVVDKIAKEANVSVDWVKAIEKEAGGRLVRLASKLVTTGFIDRHLGGTGSDFDEKKYIEFLKQLITSFAAQGNVVILGRGSQFILPNEPGTIKILLLADLEDRIEFIAQAWNMKKNEAEQAVTSRAKRRRAFLKNLSPRDPEDPELYHLTINMSWVSLQQAEDMIVGLTKDAENRSAEN